uniref:Protein kinase domain-containing protein n=1 Tax=Haemonchus contortus TaxID=6289 RepID=A0A7I4YXW0_HAECO
MSSSEEANKPPIPLAQRILALQMKNRKKLHMYEASRTSQSEGNKENSLLSTSITARQNKTAPPGHAFDMSKINDSLASAPHNKSSNIPSERNVIYTPLQDRRRPPTPTSAQKQLSAIEERHVEKEHSGNRSRPLEPENRLAMDAPIKSRSKSVGSKEAHRDAIPQSSTGLRPSASTSSLQNKYMVINGHSYIWLSLLGKGGSSRVYEVFDEARCEVCALKVVDLGDDNAARQCYLNEIELLKSLQSSPYVIKMLEYELREEENTLYVVMEKGDIDLATFLKTRRTEIDSSFIRYHWKEMLRCVKVIHDRKIVHSDLKPANFLLVKGTVKLIDFGIAAGIPNDMTGAIKESQMGTLSYMAPEVLQGAGGDGKFKIPLKADVWSLGCILYNLVYGRLPFNMKSQGAKMAAICNPDYVIEFPDCGDSLLVDVLKRCLVREVHQRADVNELLEHRYLTGRRPSPVPSNSLDASECGPELDYLAIAKELQNNTPNTIARRLEELTKGQATRSTDDGRHSNVKKVLDFSP